MSLLKGRMDIWNLTKRSLVYHARSHLGTLAGASVASAVLIGALVVGDSVRGSLRQMALSRVGKASHVIAGGERVFRARLADDLSGALGRAVAPVLMMPASGIAAGGKARANQVQVLGVDPRFWRLAPAPPVFSDVEPGKVVLNQALALQLGARAGSSIVLRVQRPTALSRDAPLSPEEGASVAMRLDVQAIVSDASYGRFGLQASQIPPLNAFLSLTELGERLGHPGRANLLLVQEEAAGDLTDDGLGKALARVWTLADAQLELRFLADKGELELRSGRVFLDRAETSAGLGADARAKSFLTYFVNAFRFGDRSTPYSMVTAAQPPLVPEDLADGEIVVNRWLAEDLGVKPGDSINLKYYVVGLGRALVEKEQGFRVRSIVALAAPYLDRDLMPDFPGLKDAKNCRDWDTGFPISLDAIRDKDNQYWTDYRGTPKAFVTLAAGQRLWRNRFGDLTAIRYPVKQGDEASAKDRIAKAVLSRLSPRAVGIAIRPLKQEALAAVNQAQDFAGLFVGFSFFLIAAAILLTSLLFQFSVEQRSKEVGILLALGFTPKRVKRLLLSEGAVLAVFGGVAGAGGAVLYAWAMLEGLATVWRGAVGTSMLGFHVSAGTLAGGAAGGIIVALLTMMLALRQQGRQAARALLMQEAGGETTPGDTAGPARRPLWIALASAVLALGIVGGAVAAGDLTSAGAFFGAGGLLLVAGWFLCSFLLRLHSGGRDPGALTLSALGIRNSARRRKRSLATIGLLACGTFLVVAIGVFRLDAVKDADQRSSGTGGFLFWGETTQPVIYDLNRPKGLDYFGLDPKELPGVRFVPFRVHAGDDASCLNLNRARQPRLIGVDPDLLSDRKAFTFAEIAGDLKNEGSPWQLLASTQPDGPVPAIADQNSILWAMGKKVGDRLVYTAENGEPFEVRLVAATANSILQGNVIISERAFVEHYPSLSGYRMFLVDAPREDRDALSVRLSRALQDMGLELVPAVRRLNAFNRVQNTYLSTFQVLGGLGILLGSLGLGVVVMRNVWERRGELAVLRSVGFRRSMLTWLVMSEHGGLLALGLAVGMVAAIVAVVPAVMTPGSAIPYRSLVATLGAVFAAGLLWTWLAARLALKGELIEALRHE